MTVPNEPSGDEPPVRQSALGDVPPLTAEQVLLSGWNAKYAKVIFAVSEGASGGALVDGNGDGAELELEVWHWSPTDGWRCGQASGAGPKEEPGDQAVIRSCAGWAPMVATGTAPPGALVHVGFEDEVRTATTNSDGAWLALYVPDPNNWLYTDPFIVDWEPGDPSR